MPKTPKRGFRGERKGILTPSLSQGEGECCDGKSKETSHLTHTPFSRYTYPVVAGYFQKRKLWRVFYSVNPRTPEGGQAGKADKPPPYTYPAIAGYLGEGEGSDGKRNK